MPERCPRRRRHGHRQEHEGERSGWGRRAGDDGCGLNKVMAKGKKPMPGYEGKLTPDQINDLVNYYIRNLEK